MSKKLKIALILILSILVAGVAYVFTYVPPLSPAHGVVETKLYLGQAEKQPLIVAFGGGGGGNDWARNYLKGKRDSLNQMGFAVLAVGYFKTGNTPEHLDRISLDAIRDSIMAVAQHPNIDRTKIILMGGSRGAELALNLAARFDDFTGVIAMSAAHVSFPAITWSANTASWMYQGQEVPYVPAPFKTISPALEGDLYTAHSMMLEDQEAVKKAEIPVENIKGPILILSGKNDEQWPAAAMSDQMVNRLQRHQFKHDVVHMKLEGGHIAPLEHFDLVYDFLDKYFLVE